MKIKFGEQKTAVELRNGFYDIYVLGGFYVKANENFKVKITGIGNKEKILVKEYFYKSKGFMHEGRGVRYFNFKISNSGVYEISSYCFEDMVVKKSWLRYLRFFQESVDLDKLHLSIETGIE